MWLDGRLIPAQKKGMRYAWHKSRAMGMPLEQYVATMHHFKFVDWRSPVLRSVRLPSLTDWLVPHTASCVLHSSCLKSSDGRVDRWLTRLYVGGVWPHIDAKHDRHAFAAVVVGCAICALLFWWHIVQYTRNCHDAAWMNHIEITHIATLVVTLVVLGVAPIIFIPERREDDGFMLWAASACCWFGMLLWLTMNNHPADVRSTPLHVSIHDICIGNSTLSGHRIYVGDLCSEGLVDPVTVSKQDRVVVNRQAVAPNCTLLLDALDSASWPDCTDAQISIRQRIPGRSSIIIFARAFTAAASALEDESTLINTDRIACFMLLAAAAILVYGIVVIRCRAYMQCPCRLHRITTRAKIRHFIRYGRAAVKRFFARR